MIKQHITIIFLVFFIPGITAGQYPDRSFGYQMTMLCNPGLTGAEGDGFIRVSYMNYYPGQGYDLFSGSISYDGYIPSLHGGAGFYISNDYIGGIINDLQGGFSYSYYFQAGDRFFISAGLSASLYHRGYNFNGAVLPDQIGFPGSIDPVSAETIVSEGKNVLDLATGFFLMTERFFWGLAVSHLTQPDIDHSDGTGGKLERKLLLHGAGDFEMIRDKSLKIRPMGMLEISKNSFSAGTGAVIEGKYLSVNTLLFGGKEGTFDMQAGFAVDMGSLEFFYNYRFNLVSGSTLLPFSLSHQTGISFNIYNVEKRRIVNTINYPNL